MDGTYYKFRKIMELVETFPNDMELGEAVRNYYWTNWQKQSQNHLQLKFDFGDEPIIDADIDSVARRAED
jgi:hypothetical protein